MHLVFELIASMNANESDKTTTNPKTKIEMKEIGDKSSVLSPITGFQTQNPFRKPLWFIAIFSTILGKQNGFAKLESG